MYEVEMISSNKDSVDVASGEHGLGKDYNRGDELRQSVFKHFVDTMDLFQRSDVGCARETLQNGYRDLLALTPETFCNPTDYEKQHVRRVKDMSLECVSGPPLCGVILLDQMDSDQDDHFYINFTNAFGALAFKLQEHTIAVEVFKLAMNSRGADSSPHHDMKVDFELSVVVATANIGCVYLILGQLEKAKEHQNCALKSLERFKLAKSIRTLEVDIFAVENNLSIVLQGQQNYPAAIKLQNHLVSKAEHLRLPFRMVAAMHYNRAEMLLELEADHVKALEELQNLKSLSETLDDKNRIPREFISSKICLVYLLMGEVAIAEEIALKLSLSPAFSLFLPSISSPWLPSSSSSSSSLWSSSLSTSSSSSSSSSLASSSSSPPLSPLPSSSSFSPEFEVFTKSTGELPWDFSVAALVNLVDFHLYQENVQPLSMILDRCASKWKQMFGKNHPTCASLLYRQGVTFSLMRENVSSKNCFEEALSIFTRAGFASTHPEVSKCNAALARLLLCENFRKESFLNSQSIARTPSDSHELCKKSQEFIFSDRITSSSLFEKFAKQIIKSEEKIGEISELVKTNNLLKVQGPSVGQITVWLHDRSIKINTQPTHARKSLAANYEESLPCNCTDISEILLEEMKMCASTLGVNFETCAETSSCPSPLQIPAVLLMNPTQTPNVKAMTGASHGDQNAFDDGESGASASFSSRDMAAKVHENSNASILPWTMTDQELISGEKISFRSHDQTNEKEISAVIAPSSSFSKMDEDKVNEDSVNLPIKVFSQYDAILTTDESRDTEEPYTKAKTKRNAASDQSRNERQCSPLTLKADEEQTSKNGTQQVIGTQKDSSVKPCVIDDQQEYCADDVTDGVDTFHVSSSEFITVERDHNDEQERNLRISEEESYRDRKVVEIERSSEQDAVKRMGISRNRKERGGLAYSKEDDANNSSCRGEDVVADNGDANHADEVLGACGYQKKRYPQDAESKDANEPGSKKMGKERLGLKGGRRDEYSSNHSSLYSSCTSESSQLGIKSGFLARHSNDNSMSCGMDETEGRLNCTHFSQFPDSYPPEQSFYLPYNSKYRSLNTEENLSLPPPPPQFPSLPYDAPRERHHVSENYSDIGRPALSVHSTSTTPNSISEQTETSLASERALRQQKRERIKRGTATARVSTDGESTTMQPILPNNNSGTTSDDDSLAALERRVAEACSLVERVLKEREEKVGAIKERERRQKEERARRELHEQQERKEREAKKTMQSNESGEGNSTGSEEGAPSERAVLPERPQWLCEHYQRLCRVKFPCCGRFYPCHRCHNNSDECENDSCKAKEALYIECSVCRHQQAINRDALTCARCNTRMSAYFCSICKHFTGKDKHPYHCTKCGICRIHKDRSFHCDVCNVCLDKRLRGKHKCRPDSGHDECCICLEDAFSGCQILPCSHKVHRECAIAMIQNGIRSCPICRHPLYSQSAGTE